MAFVGAQIQVNMVRSMSMAEHLYYFGLPFNDISLSEAVERTEEMLGDGKQHRIITPNPEMVVLSREDESFAEVLRRADLSLIDGVGLQIAFFLFGHTWVHRTTGTDFLMRLLQSLGSKHSFFFLGAEQGTSQAAATKAQTTYGTNVVGTYEPTRGTYEYKNTLVVHNPEEHAQLMKQLRESKPEVLVVALGHGLQEQWIDRFLPELPFVRVAIGVGGALDYLSGRVKRAPVFIRRLGLEWLWRLGTQPSRAGRIATAVFTFPLLTLVWFFSSHFRYRPSVVGCLINAEGNILLVSRIDDPTHWQFPQGGQEKGESPEEAILREMREELGTDKMEIIGRSRPNVYRYSWKKSWRKRRQLGDPNVPMRNYGFRGQRQTIFYLRYLGTNRHLKIDTTEHLAWKWIEPSHLLAVVHPVRRPLAAIVLRELNDHYHD